MKNVKRKTASKREQRKCICSAEREQIQDDEVGLKRKTEGMTLSHLSRQVSLGALVRGVGEHGGGIAILHQFAQVHEHGLG